MIKLRADWCERCRSCGTELVVDLLDARPEEYACPWCGVSVQVGPTNTNQQIRDRLASALHELEAKMNDEMV